MDTNSVDIPTPQDDNEGQSNIELTETSYGAFTVTITQAVSTIEKSDAVFRSIYDKVKNLDSHIIINISNCPVISSVSIGTVTLLSNEKATKGMNIIFIDAPRRLQDTLQMCDIHNRFVFCDTEKEAEELLKKE